MSEQLLRLDHITMQFGGVVAVDDLELVVNEGEIVALIGPNGAGKTTIFNLLTKVYQPTTGTVLLDGKDTHGMNTMQVNRAGIARTFQNIRLFTNMSVEDNVKCAMDASLHCSMAGSILRLPGFFREEKAAHDRAMELLEIFGMQDLADAKAGSLPYGAQRRLEIARALATNPSLLLLDEPAAGLDPQGRRDIFGGIRAYNRETGSTVVIVSHSMEDMAQYCDDVAVMAHARLLMTGTRDEVFARADELEAVGLDIPVITKLSALLRQGGLPLDPGLYTLEAAEAALAQVFGLPADREGGRKR